MDKRLILAAALAAPALTATPALALQSDRLYKVCFEHEVVGTWRLRNRVVDSGGSCQYTVKWQNLHIPRPLKRSALCRIDEYKAGDDFDCERNRRRFFNTLVERSPQSSCFGFDEFGQQTRVAQLIAGENEEGMLFGIVETASIGDVQNLMIVPSDR